MAARLLLISGSLRAGSTNTAMLRTAMAVAPEHVRTELYDGTEALPHFSPDDDREGEAVHGAVAELRAAIRGADALLLCTPEYAGALPGSLKNLLEWTVGDGGTYGKPVGWINASGPAAPTGGADAHDSLRKVLGYVGADVVEGACARIPTTRDGIGPDGTFADPGLRRRVAGVVAALAEGDAVARADDAFFAALLEGRAPAVEEALTEDFVIVEVREGSVVPRADFVAAIEAGDVAFERIDTFPEERLVRHYGDVAVVVGRTRMGFALGDGTSFSAGSRYTHVFRRAEDASWRLATAQGTTIP